MSAKFEIFKGTDSLFHWRFKAPNGEIVAQSEAYSSKQGAETGINSLKKRAADAAVEDSTANKAYAFR